MNNPRDWQQQNQTAQTAPVSRGGEPWVALGAALQGRTGVSGVQSKPSLPSPTPDKTSAEGLWVDSYSWVYHRHRAQHTARRRITFNIL